MSCTWCKGQGKIKRPLFLGGQAVVLDWASVLGSVALAVIFIRLFGETHGFLALGVLSLVVILVPLAQLLIGISDILSWMGLLTRFVVCPHCSGRNVSHNKSRDAQAEMRSD